MPDQGINFIALLGGFLRGAMQRSMSEQDKSARKTEVENPLLEIYKSIITDPKMPSAERKSAYEALGKISGGELPPINFQEEKPELSTGEKMSTIATEKPIAKMKYPGFEEAMAGGAPKYQGMIGGLTPEQKIQGIQSVGISGNVPQEKTQALMESYGLVKQKQEEPELTLTQFMDRYAKADQAGQKRLTELFPQYSKYAVNYKYDDSGLPLSFHEKARELTRLNAIIDDYDGAIKAISIGKTGMAMPGREKELERLITEKANYVKKRDSLTFYGEPVKTEEPLPEGLPTELPGSHKKRIPGF